MGIAGLTESAYSPGLRGARVLTMARYCRLPYCLREPFVISIPCAIPASVLVLSIALPLAQRLTIAFMLPVVNDASMAMPSAEALHTLASDLSPVLLHSHTIQAETQ